MTRRLLVTALVAAPLVALAPGASAYCDPDYRPLCTNDCRMRPPDPANPTEILTRVCPA